MHDRPTVAALFPATLAQRPLAHDAKFHVVRGVGARRSAVDSREVFIARSARGNGLTAEYVELRDGAYRVAGSRVSLDSIVYAYIAGESPESIAQSFPVLTLDQVSGAIAFYLGHRDEVDAYLLAQRAGYEAKRAASRVADPTFHNKLAAAKGAPRHDGLCAAQSSLEGDSTWLR
jgi:uncharacterized protein (DUF433 family)